MNKQKYAITFACYNALEYTQQCIESMLRCGTPLDRVVIVDNGSTDGTREYIAQLGPVHKIYNQDNYACGVAWNQGALALQAEWTIVMNNDVLVSPQWVESLIGCAETRGLKVISPALIEGELDYDFEKFSAAASSKMADVCRAGGRHAVCLAVHHSVWMDVGYFRAAPRLLGYGDTLFFNELEKASVPVGITGASWLHHYGSVTQTLMKQERGLTNSQGLGYRYNYRLLQQSWLERKWSKWQRKQQQRQWIADEMARYGMTLHGLREGADFKWI